MSKCMAIAQETAMTLTVSEAGLGGQNERFSPCP